MTHDELRDLLAPHALETLTAAERALVETHLPGCAECRRALADFRTAALALPLTVDPQTPPPAVKARLLRRIQNPWPRRLALAAGLLMTVGLGGLWVRRAGTPLEVLSLSGPLRANGHPVHAGDRLSLGQRLTATGTADFRWASRAVFRLQPGSEALIQRAGSGLQIRLWAGGLLSVVKPGNTFSVRTPVAVAAVRGTVFYVGVDAPDKTYVCICNGRLHIENGNRAQDLAADHHKAVDLTSADTTPGFLRRHTDADIAALTAQGW